MENCVFKDILGNEILLPYSDSTKRILNEYLTSGNNQINFLQDIPELLNFLFEQRKDKKLNVLDIGANGGLFSLYAASVCENVFAIEPSSVLCNNIRLFAKEINNITVCNCAISNKEGMISYYFFPDCTGQSTIHNRAKAKNAEAIKLSVNAYTIESFAKKYKIDYIDICKVDIEGEEVNLFDDESIERLEPLVDRFWIEVHHTAHINGKLMQDNYKEITSRFKQHGYNILEDIDHYGFIAYK